LLPFIGLFFIGSIYSFRFIRFTIRTIFGRFLNTSKPGNLAPIAVVMAFAAVALLRL